MGERQTKNHAISSLAFVVVLASWGCGRGESEATQELCRPALTMRSGGEEATCYPDTACALAESAGLKVAFFVSLNVEDGQGGKISEAKQAANRKCIVDEIMKSAEVVDPESDRYHAITAVGVYEKLRRLRSLALVANMEVACHNSAEYEVCSHCWSLGQEACMRNPFCALITPVREAALSQTKSCVQLGAATFAGCQPADLGCDDTPGLFTKDNVCFVGAYCGGMTRFGWSRAQLGECPDESISECPDNL